MNRPVPQYVDEMTDGAVSRLNNLKTEHTASFAFMTDIHNCTDYLQRALYSIADINRRHPIALTVLGGDYLCNNDTSTRELALSQHAELKASVCEFLDKGHEIAVLCGNHDTNEFGAAENALTLHEVYDAVASHHSGRFVCNPDDPKSHYGYYDDEKSKIRVIFLNSCENTHKIENGRVVRYAPVQHIFGHKQLCWLANVALNTPSNDWGVLVFSHFAPVPSAMMDVRPLGGEQALEILLAYKNGTKYSASIDKDGISLAVECDFTSRGAGDVIGWICGHIHADRTTKMSGIRVISVLSAASDNFRVAPASDGTIYHKVRGSGEESAFTVFVVNREKRIINTIRCGAGRDCCFDY